MVLCQPCEERDQLSWLPLEPRQCAGCQRTIYPLVQETLCEKCAKRMNVCESCGRLLSGSTLTWPLSSARSWMGWSLIQMERLKRQALSKT